MESMHTPINTKVHGILDYVAVALFAIAPLVFGMTGAAAILSYIFAVVHLAITLLTNFDLGVMDTIDVQIHRGIELVFGFMVFVAFIFAYQNDLAAGLFYSLIGSFIIVVTAFTEYTASPKMTEKTASDSAATV